MSTIRLPVSGIEVILRPPTGAEDMLLVEAPVYDTAFALEFIARLASSVNGVAVEWATLCVTDLDALLLLLRHMIFGDLIRTDIVCPTEGCGKRIDIAFRIREYLAYHQPRKARGVEAVDEAGWFRLRDTPVSFRLPTGADQIAVATATKPLHALIHRCIRPTDIPARLVKRVETAMETLAPSLSDNLQGQCLECSMTIDMYFDIQQFVLSELRNQAAFVYEDVHLLAKHYHWTQAEILSLPRSWRIRYTEMLQQERSLV
jgi:hypothetical protein